MCWIQFYCFGILIMQMSNEATSSNQKNVPHQKKSFLTMRKQVYFQFSYKLCFLACFLRKNTDSPRINTLNDDFHRRYEPWIKWSNHLLITKKAPSNHCSLLRANCQLFSDVFRMRIKNTFYNYKRSVPCDHIFLDILIRSFLCIINDIML